MMGKKTTLLYMSYWKNCGILLRYVSRMLSARKAKTLSRSVLPVISYSDSSDYRWRWDIAIIPFLPQGGSKRSSISSLPHH